MSKQADQTPVEDMAPVLTKEDEREFKLSVMKSETATMNPVEYAQTRKLADDFLKSGAVSDSFENTEQVMMALMAGREMGMSAMQAMNGLYFVNGKLSIYGKETPAALRRHGWQIRYTNETPESCTAVVSNPKTKEVIEETFTFEEAKQSGFVTDSNGRIKFGWKQGSNRRRKLRYGVLSLIIHTYLPDVVGGVTGIGEYSRDYMEASTMEAAPRLVSYDIVEAAKEQLRACTTIDELREVYMGLSKAVMAEVADVKDEVKAKLEASGEDTEPEAR